MIAEPTRKPHQDDHDRDTHERRYQEKALDEALKNTFPASDPVSVEQPTPPAADRDRAKTSERAAQIGARSLGAGDARSRNELEAEQNLMQGNLCTVTGRTTETCDHADLSK
jgi:hypothetical protein